MRIQARFSLASGTEATAAASEGALSMKLCLQSGLALAAALAAALAPANARAADEEIQVYMDEMDAVGRFGLDVHLNYVPKGRRADVDYLGQQGSQDRFRITPEFSYGLTQNLELGLYLPLATVDEHRRAEVGGVKGRIKFIAPKPADSPFFWGLNFELGRVRRNLDVNPWNAELKGIAGVRSGPWTMAGNLNLDWVVSGPEHDPATLQLATKVSYALDKDLAVGLESYNDLGPARRPGRLGNKDQTIYLVADKGLGKWDLQLGAGYGYGAPEDRWILKAILGVPID